MALILPRMNASHFACLENHYDGSEGENFRAGDDSEMGLTHSILLCDETMKPGNATKSELGRRKDRKRDSEKSRQ